MVSLMIYLISHSFSLILDIFMRLGDNFMLILIRIFQLIFPPLQAMNIKDVIGSFSEFSLPFFISNWVFGLMYISIILFFTIQIFSRKTFEN
jgi:hypothetical protein